MFFKMPTLNVSVPAVPAAKHLTDKVTVTGWGSQGSINMLNLISGLFGHTFRELVHASIHVMS